MYETLVRDTTRPPTGNGGVRATSLGKRYGDLWALRDLELDVAPGQVLGLLGHNGAGKTTAIRILTTLAKPTTGAASVAGYDTVSDAHIVRTRIGVASQQATVDGLMSARLNLELIGRLHRMSRSDARQRADELLERLDLSDASARLVKTFSGGMRRRLDLAASLVARPEVLFLDEPTTGLDPRSRNDLWDMLRDLVREGTTVVLTTQYLEEADRLADDIVLLDHGRTIAQGTPSELKARVGNDRIGITVANSSELVPAASAISALIGGDPAIDSDLLCVTAALADGVGLIDVTRALDHAHIDVADIDRRQPTLDDVFLMLTSTHPAPESGDES